MISVLGDLWHNTGVLVESDGVAAMSQNVKTLLVFISYARENVPASERNMVGDLEVFLKSMTHGLGDGLVTVESTRLEGIDHRTVRGTHLSMIRNVSEKSSRIPPSVPMITDYLGRISSE